MGDWNPEDFATVGGEKPQASASADWNPLDFAKLDTAKKPPDANSTLDKLQSATGDARDKLYEQLKSEAEPLDLKTRFAVKLAPMPEQGVKLLQSKFGADNVVDVGHGNVAIKRQGQKPLLLEGAGNAFLELGKDIVDVIPEIATGVVAAGTSALAGGPTNPAGVAAGAGGAMAAQVGRQEAFKAAGGDPGTLGERAVDVGKTGILDVIGGQLARPIGWAASKGLNAIWSHLPGTEARLGAKLAVEAGNEGAGPVAKEVARDAYATAGAAKMAITPAEATRGLGAVEKEAAARAAHPEVFRQMDIARSLRASQEAEKLLGAIGPKMSGEEAGRLAAAAHIRDVSGIINSRTAEAAKQFGEAEVLGGGKALIDPAKARATIDEILGVSKTGGEALQELRSKLDGLMTVRAFQDQLSLVGKGTQGQVKFYGGARGAAGNTEVAKRVYGAMMDDLGAAAASPTAGPAAGALSAARDTYRQLSQELAAKQSGTLARLIKQMAPQGSDLAQLSAENLGKTNTLARSLMSSTISEADAGKLLTAVNSASPEAAAGLRRAVVERMLAPAAPPAGTTEATLGVTVDLGKLAEIVLGPKGRAARFATLLGGEKSPQWVALQNLAKTGQVIGAAARARGQAAPGMPGLIDGMVSQLAGAVGGAAVTGTPGGAVKGMVAATVLQRLKAKLTNPVSLAETFADPEKSMLMLGLMKKAGEGVNTKAAADSTSRIATKLLASYGPDETENQDNQP